MSVLKTPPGESHWPMSTLQQGKGRWVLFSVLLQCMELSTPRLKEVYYYYSVPESLLDFVFFGQNMSLRTTFFNIF